MANRIDYRTVEVPTVLHDRLKALRVHPRQPLHDVIEDALDFWEELHAPLHPHGRVPCLDSWQAP